MCTDKNDDDSVGYRNPPKHSRFKPGQSGNPNGRPTGSRNTATTLRKILQEKVTVNQGSVKTRMSRLEVMIHAAARKAVQGDSRAYRNVMFWADYCGLVNALDPPPENQLGGVVTYSQLEAYTKKQKADNAADSDTTMD